MSLALTWRRLSCHGQRDQTGERRSEPISAWLMVSDAVRPVDTVRRAALVVALLGERLGSPGRVDRIRRTRRRGIWRMYYTARTTAGHGILGQRIGIIESEDLYVW
jgi:hypothetical protein